MSRTHLEEAAEGQTRAVGHYADEEEDKFDVAGIAGGAVNDLLRRELEKVARNVLDPDTNPKTARVVTLTISVVPDESRSIGKVVIEAKAKLAPNTVPVVGHIGFGLDIRGEPVLASHDVRQGALFKRL